MKVVSNISVFILSIIFLLSTSGIVIFQSHCSCTGHDRVSIYVSPETCEEDYHFHHTHNEGGEELASLEHECHECTAHTDKCGCNAPRVNLLKLDNQVVNEKIRIEKLQPVLLKIFAEVSTFHPLFADETSDFGFSYIDPPIVQTSSDFLILIRQLKIPDLA